jgi:hypothetical protein
MPRSAELLRMLALIEKILVAVEESCKDRKPQHRLPGSHPKQLHSLRICGRTQILIQSG